VLGAEGWHLGVIGIVASRLVEEFSRPSILLAIDGERARGSGRSVRGVDLCASLRECRDSLVAFGGHAMAAGVEVDPARIGEFRAALLRAVSFDPQGLCPEVEYDFGIDLSDLTHEALAEIALLAPHGNGNPQPLFVAEVLDVVGKPRVLGDDGRHLAFHVRGRNQVRRAIAFGMGDFFPRLARPGARVSLLLEPRVSTWQGRSDIELNVREIRVL
jgi:single-stranded-DNA-specific exonuclease